MNDSTKLELAPGVTVQHLGAGEGAVLVRNERLYSCNDTTAALIGALASKRSLGSLTDNLMSQFEVERDTLQRDIVRVAEELVSEGLLILER